MLCKTVGLVVWRKPFCTSNLFFIPFLFSSLLSFMGRRVPSVWIRCRTSWGGAQRWRTHSTHPVRTEYVLRVIIRLLEGFNNCGSGMSHSSTRTEYTLVSALQVPNQWGSREFSCRILVVRPLNLWTLHILFETSQYFSEIIRCYFSNLILILSPFTINKMTLTLNLRVRLL